jgi:ankyrin repeat protein
MSDEFAEAIFLDDLKTIEELIDAGSIDINANLSIHRQTPPLVYAVEIARKAVVEALLRAGANIDSVNDGRRFTACHAAVMNSLDGLLPVLLAYRPNLALKDADGFTPLHLAIVHRRDRIAVMLIEAGAPVDLTLSLVVKFIATNKNATQAVIKRGLDLRNVQYESGRTPLHAAASKSRDRDLLQTARHCLRFGRTCQARWHVHSPRRCLSECICASLFHHRRRQRERAVRPQPPDAAAHDG